MNDIHRDKQTHTRPWSAKLAITLALAASLLVTQGTALADNGRGKARSQDSVPATMKQDHRTHHGKYRVSSHHRQNVVSHKGHGIKQGGHGKWHDHGSHGRHGHHHDRHHQHRHVHSVPVLRSYHHVHDHGYHDPRITLGIHLGHFDLYFED